MSAEILQTMTWRTEIKQKGVHIFWRAIIVYGRAISKADAATHRLHLPVAQKVKCLRLSNVSNGSGISLMDTFECQNGYTMP